jgi:hypothetical protein
MDRRLTMSTATRPMMATTIGIVLLFADYLFLAVVVVVVVVAVVVVRYLLHLL